MAAFRKIQLYLSPLKLEAGSQENRVFRKKDLNLIGFDSVYLIMSLSVYMDSLDRTLIKSIFLAAMLFPKCE